MKKNKLVIEASKDNEIPEGILFDEIEGFNPIIINGDLNLVK